MASEKISQMPTGTTPQSADLVPLVQGGANVKITIATLFNNDVSWTTSGSCNVASLTTGGGVVVLGNLPTSDPDFAGQLWNNNGVVMVSAGG